MRFLAAAALALALSFPAVACDVTKQQVIDTLTQNGVPFKDIPAELLPDFLASVAPIADVNVDDVTGALLADFGGLIMYGLETKDGCFSAKPILLPGQVPAGVGA